ncbi:RcnB family protein [Sphingomonas sp. 37zxx]|uniref:RcnB family protein n=1 Tax=Sphingomonas sp. 37zxx TaxID=1550073 RepID=UPI00068F6ED3|nr:RcnB family protein [Sphingomonas sp. 37zxx]
MRSLMMTAVLVSTVPFGAVAVAQQPQAGARQPTQRVAATRPMPQQARWGDRYQGRWVAGYRAPGGWEAYRRPVRGYGIPSYWVQPSFYIADFAAYGLGAPQPGYGWYRYYDDAVLVDERGYVQDSVAGVEWDRDGRAYVDYDQVYAHEYYADAPPVQAPVVAQAPAAVRYGPRSEVVQPLPSERRAEHRAQPMRQAARTVKTITTTSYPHGTVPQPQTVTTTPGYIANGYYYPPVTTTTITYGHPVVTTTVTEEVIRYAGEKRGRRSR